MPQECDFFLEIFELKNFFFEEGIIVQGLKPPRKVKAGLAPDPHACPDCSRPVHVICGHPVDGMEGYGSQVYCNSCWLKRREMNILKNREISKRGQSKQIDRMGKQSRKKVHSFVVGDNILSIAHS